MFSIKESEQRDLRKSPKYEVFLSRVNEQIKVFRLTVEKREVGIHSLYGNVSTSTIGDDGQGNDDEDDMELDMVDEDGLE